MSKTTHILHKLQTITTALAMTGILALAITRALGQWPEWMIHLELIVKAALK